MSCVTHHYACDCREAKFKEIEKELDSSKKRIEGLNIGLRTCIDERDALRAALEEIMRVGTTGDGNTVECSIAYKALGEAGCFDK